MNNQVDLDIIIDGEMETIPTTSSSYIIPLTDNLTAAIDNDDNSGNKSTAIDSLMIDDTSSSNEHIATNYSEANNNNDNNTDSNNDHLNIAVTDDDINIDSSNPTRVNTASIPSRGGNMTASVDSANLQYLLEKQKMTKLQLAQTNLKSVKQFRLQNEKLHRELEIAYRKRKEIEAPLQEAMTLIEIMEGKVARREEMIVRLRRHIEIDLFRVPQETVEGRMEMHEQLVKSDYLIRVQLMDQLSELQRQNAK
jgi:hypothetical protein